MHIVSCLRFTGLDSIVEPYMIRCYSYSVVAPKEWSAVKTDEGRLLGAQALRVAMRLDRELREARADWNQDRFRRVMHARSKAVARLFRRWAAIDPPPAIPLGKWRSRYHANLADSHYKSRR